MLDEFTKNLPKTSTFVGTVRQASQHPARQFGWYWEITEDVDFLTTDLFRQGRVIDVWSTPQFKAIEWLTEQNKMRFPANLDASLHGAFCKILRMEALCRHPLLHGDLVGAIETIQQASDKIIAAADDLFSLRPEIIDFFNRLPSNCSVDLRRISSAQADYSLQLGAMIGVLQGRIAMQHDLQREFSGASSSPKGGRPSNWVARYITQQAADIYRTAFPGPITYTGKSKRPSFRVFLEKFSESYPEAERADTRELDRYVRRGGYEGRPFAPVR